MDTINSTNIHSLSALDLNTKFQDRCYAEWSKTDLILIVSIDGIYILKPQLDIPHGPFQVELIRNPNSKFSHHVLNEAGFAKFDHIWQTLDTTQYMEVFLDPALITNVESLSLDLYPRRYRLARWSPVLECYPRQSILAVLTTDYQLLIFTQKNKTWVPQIDLSQEFDKLWPQLHNVEDLKPSDRFEAMRKNLHSLSFCNLCWKQSDHGGPVLLAATIFGDIAVWQIQVSNYQSIVRPEFKLIMRTNLNYITSMHFFQSLLILSARYGQVVMYDLTTILNEIEAPATSQPPTNGHSESIPLITLTPAATLWHRDDIEVIDFYIQPISQDTFRIALAKSTNICWCLINYKKNIGDELATLTISDSFSAIDGLDPDVSMYQTPATWLKPAGDKKAVVIADDGSFFQLEFVDDRQDASPEFNCIRTGKIDLSRMVPRGLCISPGGHLIAMISCISLIYEPLKILAPTKVVLIPTINDKEFLVDCFKKLLNDEWLASEHIKSPMDVSDRTDYIRSIYPMLIYEQLHELYEILREAILATGVPKNNIQLVKLKICAFLLAQLLKQHSNTNMMEGDQRIDLDKKVYDVILLCNVERILASTLIESTHEDKIGAFSNNQVNSMRNFFAWLKQCQEGKHLIERYVDKFEEMESKHSDKPMESCSICSADINFLSPKYGTCTQGHRFDRCARSLLVVNLSISDELVCERCNRHYSSNLIWPTGDLWLCSFCQ